jgi:hypothetical protein
VEKNILWGLLIIGFALVFFSLRKPPIKDWILIFLLTSNISIIIGTFVVAKNMLEYPVRFLNKQFDSSLLFESLLLPVVCVYFYQTTYHSGYRGIVLQGLLYTSVLTMIEVLFEKYTDLVEYHTWTWMHTFIGVFLLMLFVRIIYAVDKRENR